MSKATQLAATRRANKILHIVPVGNRHARCGVVAEYAIHMPTAVNSIVAGVHALCRNCNRVSAPRDTRRPVDPYLSEPTNTWSVMDRAGREIHRAYGTTTDQARHNALKATSVRAVADREGEFSLRRYDRAGLRAAQAVDALMESTLPTVTLHAILHRQSGLCVEGRRPVCAALAARGITPERVRELNV